MIEVESEAGIRTIRLARPTARNALTTAGLQQLNDELEAADEPVVYLTGAGDAFCAGADFAEIDGLTDRQAATAFARLGQSVTRAMETSEAIVVAGIDGPARGGGVELALAADLRVATPTATFAETGVDIGLFGAWGGTVRLPEVVGRAQAKDLALSGRTIDASEARRIGLVTRITEDPESVAQELATKPTRSLRAIKRLLSRSDPHENQFEREASAFAELIVDGPTLPD